MQPINLELNTKIHYHWEIASSTGNYVLQIQIPSINKILSINTFYTALDKLS